MRAQSLVFGAVTAFALALPLPARAAHHLWRVQQLYSNASGTSQFIELETTSGGRTGETQLGGPPPFTLASGSNSVPFTNLTPGPSGATQWLLLSTPDHPGGVKPDFEISANFFATGGGTINYASNTDLWNYGTVPTDGVNALMRDPDTLTVTTGVARPINLDGVIGQIGPPTPALPGWAIALLTGGLLLAGSGLLRRQPGGAAAA